MRTYALAAAAALLCSTPAFSQNTNSGTNAPAATTGQNAPAPSTTERRAAPPAAQSGGRRAETGSGAAERPRARSGRGMRGHRMYRGHRVYRGYRYGWRHHRWHGRYYRPWGWGWGWRHRHHRWWW